MSFSRTVAHQSRSIGRVSCPYRNSGEVIPEGLACWQPTGNRSRVLAPSIPRWQAYSASVLHGTLYVLLFLVPLAGYVRRLAGAHPVSFFGLVDMPVFIGRDEPLRLPTDTLHRGLVPTLALLMIAHIAAALKHKFIDRDGVAGRMGI
ncbi:cytochrome b/b6 domain-containing protein [Paraburkholderia madseniana]|uniref:Cytochrome b/b6 domain-containing protein n=1 Tax=Paraburkholderia madseniana TaxID=2599607 RepID=A0ABT3U886_9BURK|nr:MULTISPECIES: cytochrome b/b6 domain-containing protein [Paraburkholderia]MCX4144947.1 cytochrome b/b6 domain-containing protein [Paraburkholderia madseniana]